MENKRINLVYYFSGNDAEYNKQALEAVKADIINDTCSKGTKTYYYNHGEDPSKLLLNVYNGYNTELFILDWLNANTDQQWNFVDPEAGFYKLESKAPANQPDFISESGITIEAKNTTSHDDDYFEFESRYFTHDYCWAHYFHGANWVIVNDDGNLYRFNYSMFTKALYTTNKYGIRCYQLKILPEMRLRCIR